jgi:hypothetical protein
MKPSGYVLYEDARVAVIATTDSRNIKTGDMVQVWILSRSVNPVEAVKTGADADVCLDCPSRGTGHGDRKCYVTVFQAPLSIWRAYQRGRYPFLEMTEYASVFAGRKIRFGAYGEPVLIPLAIVAEMVRVSAGWTGYTHQWANPGYQEYKQYFMASVDSLAEYVRAKFAGWHTFRVRTPDSYVQPLEIVCPAANESGHRTTCSDCRLCSGTYAADQRKDIVILAHGANASKFVQIGA